VRFADEENMPGPPMVLVGVTGDVTPTWINQHVMEFAMPMFVHAYPGPQSTIEDAVFIAEATRMQLMGAFEGSNVVIGGAARMRPRRVPLWDYDGVTLDALPTNRLDHDYVRIEDLSTTAMTDPNEPKHRAAFVDLRVSWRRVRNADNFEPANTLRSIRVEFPQRFVVGSSLSAPYGIEEA
jgi:hypothetical protein